MLIDHLLQVASGRGDHPAVLSQGTPVTYRELFAQAAYVKAALERDGLGRGDVVALALEKSASYLGALLGTWLSGAAFLPLSPQLPKRRRQAILTETGCRAVIHAAGEAPPPELLGLALAGGERADLQTRAIIAPDDLAYVLYTSGSTGRPKGIRVAHRGLWPMLEHQVRAFALEPESRALFYLSTSFDAAISDLGTALLAGATLVIEPPERLVPGSTLGPTLAERGVTHWDLPPALLPHLSATELPASLRTLIIGGEPAEPAAVRALAERFLVVNVYGPTEATICTSLCACGPDWSQPLLGEPIPGVGYQVMDDQDRPSPDGELWISGPCLALGYVNQPELEASRFLHHAGERWYRTGDRVRTRPDGRLVFVGRKDRQLKVDGVLVAPEEIEAALLQHPGVGGVAAGRDADGEFTAWVEPQRGALLTVEALRLHLATIVPRGQRPRRVLLLDRLPRGSTGKVDHQALGRTAPITLEPSTSVQGPLELWLRVWSQVLGARPGLHDDLQELGADSLRALRAATLLGVEGVVVSPALLVSHRTVGAQLAAFVALAGAPDQGRSAQSLIEDVADEAPFLPRAPVGAEEAGDRVLITGATGFLGAQVLARLLGHPELSVTCLVRAPTVEAAEQRLTQAAARQGLVLPRRPDRILLGDVGEPRMGLDASLWSLVAAETNTIIHIAGAVSLTAPYERLRPTNVGGAREMLRLLSEGRKKRLHYTSTLSVFVASDVRPGFIGADAPLLLSSELYGGYAQSKWAAEHLLRSSAWAELIHFYRLGLLVGASSSARIPDLDLLAMTIRGVAELGRIPADLELRFDVTPVDHAAAVLLAVALSPEPSPKTLNVCSEAGATWSELVAAFARAGRPLQVLPPGEWREQARAQLQSGGSLNAGTAYWILARAADQARLGAFDLFQATGFQFDTRPTERSTGLVCPSLGPAELERYLVACLASSGPTPQTRTPPKGG